MIEWFRASYRRCRPAALLFAAVVGVAVWAWVGTRPPRFRSEALLRLELSPEMSMGSALLAVREHRTAMATAAYREYFLDRIDPRDREICQGSGADPAVRLEEVRDSRLIRVAVGTGDRELSARLANQYAMFYGDYLVFREKAVVREQYEILLRRDTAQRLQVERSREALRKFLLETAGMEGSGRLAERRRLQMEREEVARKYAAAEMALLEAGTPVQGVAVPGKELSGLEETRRATGEKLVELDHAIRKIDSGVGREDEQAARFSGLRAQVEADERIGAEIREKITGLKLKLDLPTAAPVVLEDEAVPASRPVPPGRWGGFFLGLLAFAGAFLMVPLVRGSLEPGFQWPWAEAAFPRRLELIPGVTTQGSRELLAACFEAPLHDAFFRVIQSLERAFFGEPHRCFLVTSALEREGKSFVAAGLAAVACAQGRRILLVDCHLASPSVGIWFPRADSGCGLLEWLQSRGDGSKQLSCQRQGDGGEGELYVVSSRGWAGDPVALLRQPCFAAWLRRAREEFDWVILDGPEIGATGESEVLARLCDGVLLVRDEAISRDKDLVKACRALEAAGARILGHLGNRGASAGS